MKVRVITRYRYISPLLLRLIALLTILSIFIHSLFVLKVTDYIVAYTQWGMIMSIILFALLTLIELFPDSFNGCQSFTDLLTEITFCSQFIIVVIFWLVITIVTLIFHQERIDLTLSVVIYNFTVHTLPALLVFLEVKNINLSFTKTHRKFTYIPLFAYGIVAITFSNVWDISRYPVFDFKDWKSLIFGIVCCGLNELGFLIGTKLYTNPQ